MRPDPGPLSLDELREYGVVLEVNRRVLHPVGLCLVWSPRGLVIERVGPGGTCRDLFDPNPGMEAKAQAFREIEAAAHPRRYAEHGFVAQPLPGEPPRVVAAAGIDGVSIWPFVRAVTDALVRTLPLDADTRALVADCVADAMPSAVLAPILQRLELQSTDGGATWWWRIGPEPEIHDHGPLQRCLFLMGEIQRLQEGGDAPIGEPNAEIREYVARAKGQLYPEEWEEFLQACNIVDGLVGRTVSEETAEDFARRVSEVCDTLERLYANAQPGVRMLRGDDAAREEFQAHRAELRDAARGAVARMSAYERLTSGELSDFDEAPWGDLQAQVEQDLASATEACAEAERQMREATVAQERASRCLEVVRRAMERGVA